MSWLTDHGSGGTIYNVIAGFYHGSYEQKNIDYDVAVLKVCTDVDTAIYILNYVMYLQ
jgi:hypothetical protein